MAGKSKCRKLTKQGKKIKKKIIDMNLSQKEFCEMYNINESRLSEVMYTNMRKDLRKKVCEILGIGA